jgi:hypothetical protein
MVYIENKPFLILTTVDDIRGIRAASISQTAAAAVTAVPQRNAGSLFFDIKCFRISDRQTLPVDPGDCR